MVSSSSKNSSVWGGGQGAHRASPGVVAILVVFFVVSCIQTIAHSLKNIDIFWMQGPNHGARDAEYYKYDNDADNFDPTLTSSSAEYFKNPDNSLAYGEDRWKSGGGIETGVRTGLDEGCNRDIDGTIDRVKDPPKEMFPLLYAVKMQASAYNISLDAAFEAAGGNARGTIPTTRFNSALSATFHRLDLKENDFEMLVQHYGTGARAPAGSAKEIAAPFECIAWKGAHALRGSKACLRDMHELLPCFSITECDELRATSQTSLRMSTRRRIHMNIFLICQVGKGPCTLVEFNMDRVAYDDANSRNLLASGGKSFKE